MELKPNLMSVLSAAVLSALVHTVARTEISCYNAACGDETQCSNRTEVSQRRRQTIDVCILPISTWMLRAVALRQCRRL